MGLVTLCACDACGAGQREGGPPEQSGTPVPEAEASKTRVTGVVRLAEGASLPSYAPEDMERELLKHAKRGEWPEACTPPKKADMQPVRLTDDGSLIGVMVAGSGFQGATPRPPKTHTVTIRDCRLTPPLVVAMKGDHLEIRNEVDFPFMPSYGRELVARTLMPGQKFDVELDRGGLGAVLCSFTAPCGRTDVVTVYHPVYAVTGDDGRFVIEDFPADQEVELNAWHPLFEETKITLQVGQGETREVELVLTPKGQPASAQAHGETGGEPEDKHTASEPPKDKTSE